MESEKILYKNETKLNKDNLQNFSKFIFLQYNKFRYWAIIIFSTLFLIFGIVGGIGQVIRFQRIPNTFTLIFILVFASIIIVMIKLGKGNVKTEENSKGALYKYEFCNNYLLISTDLASQKILYNDLYHSFVNILWNGNKYEDENIWLTQKMLATVYGVDVRTINYHIKKIYADNELEENATIRNFEIVQKEGNREVSRNVTHYNLQMIIAVGFKVNNERAVQFRKWANQIVKDYTIKGWVMDD